MSTITPTTTADACPAWCTHHSSPADDSLKPWHAAAVLVGGLTLDFSEDPDDDEGPVFSPPDSLNGLTLLEARRYALALLQACDRIGGAEPTRVRIAWRVYDRMDGPEPTDMLEALANALGVHWSHLVMEDPEHA